MMLAAGVTSVMLLLASRRMLLLAAIVTGLLTVMSRVACRYSSEKPVISVIWMVVVPTAGGSAKATSGVPFGLLGGAG